MTKFNPENKKVLSCEEVLDPAMKIIGEKDAKQYKKAYVDYIQKDMNSWSEEERVKYNPKNNTAEEIANSNLAYWAGYYGPVVRSRVEKLFLCEHPIFGKIDVNGSPTNEEAFKCGTDSKTLSEIRSEESSK